MPLSTQQLQALSDAVAASGLANQNVVTVIGAIPVDAPPPPPPPPPPVGTLLHFSAAGDNSNPGTLESPKRDLTGLGVNSLPAGSALLFNRGDAFSIAEMLENYNATAENPLVFDAYGSGAPPVFQCPNGNVFNIGGGWQNTGNDGGYTIRNIKLDGMGTGAWGIWFAHNVHDVLIEFCEITGFAIGINSNSDGPHGVTGVTMRNNHIHHNRSMGLLGHYNDLLFENNHIQANNFSGSGFDHGTYIGGGNNITVRNNHYDRNSVVNGVCQGGNMTFHGQINGLLVEGNLVEQDASAAGGWLMSINQGYSSAEALLNVVVRANTLINGGNTALSINSAPGILVEENIIINRQGTNQTAISVGSYEYGPGDIADGNATVRNNRIIRANGSGGTPVAFVNAPGSVETNNVVELE